MGQILSNLEWHYEEMLTLHISSRKLLNIFVSFEKLCFRNTILAIAKTGLKGSQTERRQIACEACSDESLN